MYLTRYDREFADHVDQFIADGNTTEVSMNACQIYYIDVRRGAINNTSVTVDSETNLEGINVCEPITDIEECVETRVNKLPKISGGFENVIQDWFHSLKDDVAYRRGFLQSLAAFWSYVTLGWFILQLGTALPDLRHLVDIDLDSASWMFTIRSIGYIVGSLISGILYDRFNRLVIMCLCELCATVCVACLPYSGEFPVMLTLLAITGVCFGGIDTGVNTIVPSIWGKKAGPYMQALYLSYTIGGIIVPFGTKPFMMSHHSQINELNKVTSNSSDNCSEEFSMTMNFTEVTSVRHNASLCEDASIENMKNQIQYAFVVTGALAFLSAIPYLMMALIGGFDFRDPINSTTTDDADGPAKKCTGKRKWLLLSCIFGISCLYSASEESLNNFMVTFCIDYLEWDDAFSATLLSLYWAASCIGGLGGIVLMRVVSTNKILFITNIAWTSTFLVSLIAGLYKIHILIWIFVPLSGIVMVIIMPALISWTEEHVCDVTGVVSAVIMISCGIGLSANPVFIGYMMENYSYMTFLYILFVESLLVLICYLFGAFWQVRIKKYT